MWSCVAAHKELVCVCRTGVDCGSEQVEAMPQAALVESGVWEAVCVHS